MTRSVTQKQALAVFDAHRGQMCHIKAGLLPERALPILGTTRNGKVIVGDYSIQFVDVEDCTILLKKTISEEDLIEISRMRGDEPSLFKKPGVLKARGLSFYKGYSIAGTDFIKGSMIFQFLVR